MEHGIDCTDGTVWERRFGTSISSRPIRISTIHLQRLLHHLARVVYPPPMAVSLITSTIGNAVCVALFEMCTTIRMKDYWLILRYAVEFIANTNAFNYLYN